MASALTTPTGQNLYVALIGGNPPGTNYGTLLLGRGNNVPQLTNRVNSITKRIPVQLEASPVLDHEDVRNPGRGPDVFTWAFDVSAPSTPWVASNVALGPNPLVSTTALAVHAADDVLGDPYRRVLIWINLGAAESTIFHLNVTDQVEAAKLRSTGARADVLFGGSGSRVLRVGEIFSHVASGESVVLRGRLYGEDGQALRPSDVRRIERRIDTYNGAKSAWVRGVVSLLSGCMLSHAATESAGLFPYRGGFNFETSLPGRETRDGVDRRITYRLELCDGNSKVLTQTVRIDAR